MGAGEGIVMDQQTLERIRKAVDDFGSVIKEYRNKEALTYDSIASRIGCSASFIFRAERGSREIPVHMKIRILREGLNWNINEIEQLLVEIGNRYEKKSR
ncbi:helix-turn-helix domain-containing protein [Lederbergia lenta]|uniref:HTH cro/C1-type domain-containing protein n=1 Tax=Lederbergia lenta TaxID=1467 RepID=A0A2X4X155_LEDLE|nr:helix-turn-helix transcriptional regulator [Lederbergia lenta]MEC2326213.1 helix-turn-helix transcriptional regulator [Lederbergia lenta]SQI63690.1 Uncharacterised protein [Lederbergia lenta]